MSIILFFGLALVIFLVGMAYVFLTLRHHWKLSHQNKHDEKKS